MNEHTDVLYVFHITLVEIRAAENTEKAQILADVVHNVPMMIRSGCSEEEVVEEIMLKAKRHGIDGYFSNLIEMAKSKRLK